MEGRGLDYVQSGTTSIASRLEVVTRICIIYPILFEGCFVTLNKLKRFQPYRHGWPKPRGVQVCSLSFRPYRLSYPFW